MNLPVSDDDFTVSDVLLYGAGCGDARQATSSVRQPDLYEKSGSPSFSEVEQPTSERDDGISASRPLYMESCTDFLLYGTSTATSTTPCIATAVTTTASIAPLREGTAHRRISYPTLTPSSSSAVSLGTVFRVDSTQLWFQFD